MSNDFNYRIDYGSIGVGPQAPRRDPDAPLYASEDGTVASLSQNECVFQVRRSGETHVMTFQVLQALDQSREFRTLDEHIARIASSIPGLQGQGEAVARVVNGLVSRKLLVSDNEFLQRVASGGTRTDVPMRAVFIRACDRPDQLGRLLDTLADYERRFRANRHYVVIDDSSDAAMADRHRDLLREFARATGCKLSYIGAAESTRLVDKLAKAVPAAGAAARGLFLRANDGMARFGGGRAWNLALLLSAGARLSLLDDDNCMPLRRPAGAVDGIDPNPSARSVTRFYRNLDNAFGAGEEYDGDPFELHLDVVGNAFGVIGADSRFAVRRQALRGIALSRLDHLDGAARVLATHQGAYGSSRTESAVWLYQLPAEERAEFVRDRDSYLRNIEAGSIWYGATQAHASMAAPFTPFAMDNSVMLPCTNALGRGEDALFSNVVRLLHPDALTIGLPVAIGHAQETQRKRSTRTLAAHTPRFNYFVTDFVQRQLPEFNAEDPARRLSLLAAHLRDVGAASESGRLRQLQEYLAYSRADLIDRLQQQYEAAPDAPIYWQADLRSIVEANGKALIAPGAPRLGDWPDDVDAATCAKQLREDANALASGYEAWPALWSYARDQGERLLDAI